MDERIVIRQPAVFGSTNGYANTNFLGHMRGGIEFISSVPFEQFVDSKKI
jgi:hypothetical protein